jgi:triacylglycerol esterase/lipase EstA (alpha/beta hydrolase family)
LPSSPPTWLYDLARANLGSIRKVYMRGNRVVRRGDVAQHEETVLLLHGFFQTRAVWEVMEDRLRYDGYGVFSFDLGGLLYRFNTRRPASLAERVGEKIERVCERYGLDRFHVVGHSQGGLVARHYIQEYGGHRRVKSLITLGTPHHGTPTAVVGSVLMLGGALSAAPWDLVPGSRFLKRLSRDTFPGDIPLVSVYSKHDLVCPYPFSILRPGPGDTSMRNHLVQAVGHTELTHDAAVYRLVRAELERATALWRERG